MSTKRAILRQLDRIRREHGSQHFTPLQTLPGFDLESEKFTGAVNGLLRERLINGVKGSDGRMEVALNGSRLTDVRRELRPWFLRPHAWVVGLALVALGAIGLLV